MAWQRFAAPAKVCRCPARAGTCSVVRRQCLPQADGQKGKWQLLHTCAVPAHLCHNWISKFKLRHTPSRHTCIRSQPLPCLQATGEDQRCCSPGQRLHVCPLSFACRPRRPSFCECMPNNAHAVGTVYLSVCICRAMLLSWLTMICWFICVCVNVRVRSTSDIQRRIPAKRGTVRGDVTSMVSTRCIVRRAAVRRLRQPIRGRPSCMICNCSGCATPRRQDLRTGSDVLLTRPKDKTSALEVMSCSSSARSVDRH
jgi:hypothetical protein